MNKETEKSPYQTPLLIFIKLDNEISLQLQSDPPVGPDESFVVGLEYFNPEQLRVFMINKLE